MNDVTINVSVEHPPAPPQPPRDWKSDLVALLPKLLRDEGTRHWLLRLALVVGGLALLREVLRAFNA